MMSFSVRSLILSVFELKDWHQKSVFLYKTAGQREKFIDPNA
jgi:hypothetical protein